MQFQSIKKLVMLALVITAFVSCNNGLTLQTYYVDNELKPGFTSIDIPTSFLDIDQMSLTQEQKDAYKSVNKLNMLSFLVNDDNRAEYEIELAKIKTIFKDPKYEELMRGGNSIDGNFLVKIIGDPDSLDELILFGNANDKGFAIVRILGDEMNAGHLVQLAMSLKDANFDEGNVNQFMDFFQ